MVSSLSLYYLNDCQYLYRGSLQENMSRICVEELSGSSHLSQKYLLIFFFHFSFLLLSIKKEGLCVYCSSFHYQFWYSLCIAASATLQSSWSGWGLSKSHLGYLRWKWSYWVAKMWTQFNGELTHIALSPPEFILCPSVFLCKKDHSGTLLLRQPLCAPTPKWDLLLLL